jgi:hypothetical protein
MVMVANPLATGELLEEGEVEAARGAEVDILDHGGLAQSGFAQTTREALVLAAGRLTIDQQAEPILAGQLGGIGSVLQLDQGIGHGRQAERAQPLHRRMDQHLLSFQW